MPAGLIAAGAKGHALEQMMWHVYNAHQCIPTEQSIWLVCNEVDRPEYSGTGGFFDDVNAQRFPHSWQREHVISNGSKTSGEWVSHVDDLKAALKNVAAVGRGHLDTFVIDANLFLWKSFNFQVLPLHCMCAPASGAACQWCSFLIASLLLSIIEGDGIGFWAIVVHALVGVPKC